MTSSKETTDCSNTKILLETCDSAVLSLAALENKAYCQLALLTMEDGKISSAKLNEKQLNKILILTLFVLFFTLIIGIQLWQNFYFVAKSLEHL